MNIAVMSEEDWEIPIFQQALNGHKITFFKEALNEKIVSRVKNADIISVFVGSQVSKAVLKKLPRLKMVATRSTGFDHIDCAECKKRGIIVSNVPAYGDNTVAEHAFALMLAVMRKLVATVERTRRGNFSLEGLRGHDLKGKMLGVIGTGKIGKNAVRIGQGFQMNVIAHDPFPDKEFAKKIGFPYVGLDKLLQQADVITLHVPLTDKTYHMINSKNISKIKKGSILINTARGGLVETHALVKALKTGIIAGAGLDVLEEEGDIAEEVELLTSAYAKKYDLRTLLEEHVLIDMDNVVITPHNAFNTEEAVRRIVDVTIENIKAFLKGKPVNVVGK